MVNEKAAKCGVLEGVHAELGSATGFLERAKGAGEGNGTVKMKGEGPEDPEMGTGEKAGDASLLGSKELIRGGRELSEK